MSNPDDKRESLLRKLSGLLAKADPDNNASEEEAMSAMAMAKRMMTQHGIDEAEVHARNGTTSSMSMKDIMRHEHRTGTIEHSCYRYIYHVIEKLAAVQIVRSKYWDQERQKMYCLVILIGTENDIAMALMMWLPLKNLMRRMPPKRAKEANRKCTCAFENGYYRGARDGILERARQAEAEVRQLASTAGEAGYALVVVNKDALVKQYMTEQMTITYTSRKSKARADAGAYDIGQRDGRNFELEERNKLK